MKEVFKNLTDNPWFWATVALSGLMLINKDIMAYKKINCGFPHNGDRFRKYGS